MARKKGSGRKTLIFAASEAPSIEGQKSGLSRRDFLKVSATAAAVSAAAVGAVAMEGSPTAAAQQAAPAATTGQMLTAAPVTLTVNGKNYNVVVNPRDTLVNVLRDVLGLTGTKRPCDRMECGGCTVNVDGKNIYSCTTLAIRMGGHKITTVEGLAQGNTLHPLQLAYVAHDAMQCSFCIPGQLMSAYTLLQNNPNPTRDQIRAAMAGNICRCGTYAHQILAIEEAAAVLNGSQASIVIPVA